MRSAVPGKRELASRVFGTMGLSRAVGALRSAVVKDLRVLAYHRVLPQLDEQTFAFDVELVSALQSEFAWQMAHLARHFRPVSCQQVADALHHGKALPRRAVMVTFDDGFRDNYEVAFPVLKRLGMPAVFFLSTGYIGGQQLFWFDRVVHLLLRSAAPSLQLEALGMTLKLTGDAMARRAVAIELLNRLKLASETERLLVLRQLELAANVLINEDESALSLPMTWAQVREMAQAGMEFGSHTVSHPILSAMSDAKQLGMELEASKDDIERATGQSVIALAYPVGGANAVNPQVLAATAHAGYSIAFTYQSGVNRLASTAPLLLKRLHVERYTSRAMFEAALQWPELFAH